MKKPQGRGPRGSKHMRSSSSRDITKRFVTDIWVAEMVNGSSAETKN